MLILKQRAILALLFISIAPQMALAKPRKLESYPATEGPAEEQTVSKAPAPISVGAQPVMSSPAAPQSALNRPDSYRSLAKTTRRPESIDDRLAEKRKMRSMPESSHSTVPVHAIGQAPSHDERGAYDPVPTDQRSSISRRLQLVEQIVRMHGRAYDYRVMTTQELEIILRKLDSAESSVAGSVQPANIQPTTVQPEVQEPREESSDDNTPIPPAPAPAPQQD